MFVLSETYDPSFLVLWSILHCLPFHTQRIACDFICLWHLAGCFPHLLELSCNLASLLFLASPFIPCPSHGPFFRPLIVQLRVSQLPSITNMFTSVASKEEVFGHTSSSKGRVVRPARAVLSCFLSPGCLLLFSKPSVSKLLPQAQTQGSPVSPLPWLPSCITVPTVEF